MVQLHSFELWLEVQLSGQLHSLVVLQPGNDSQCLPNKRQGGPHNQFGLFGEENPFP